MFDTAVARFFWFWYTMPMNNKIYIALAVLSGALAVAAGIWFFFWSRQTVAPDSRADSSAEQQALGGVLYENMGNQSNPFKQASDVAPLPAGTNPFKDAYQNPFAK